MTVKPYVMLPLLALPCLLLSNHSQALPFPAPYCDPGFNTTEPITRVLFGDIDNASSPDIYSTHTHEDYLYLSTTVTAGADYSITLEGNTAGNFTNYFSVFIDWDRNGDFLGELEQFHLPDALYNSNGKDGQQVTGSISVPASAVDGTTRMRVIKNYNFHGTACASGDNNYGQAEDYSLEVTGGLAPSGMSTVAAQLAISEGDSLLLTFDALLADSDADGSTEAFRVTGVAQGVLMIGGEPFDAATNNRINADTPAEWFAPLGNPGTSVSVLSLVAVAGDMTESFPAVTLLIEEVERIQADWSGNGSPENPYQISTPEQLHSLRYGDSWNTYYSLTADIDLNVAPWNVGSGWAPIGSYDEPFMGSLDGNGHVISGLTINRPDSDEVGLVGASSYAVFEDVHLTNVSVVGGNYTGALTGIMESGEIMDSSVQGSVTGADGEGYAIGGLGGNIIYSLAERNYANVNVTGDYGVGGLFGMFFGGELYQNHASGTVTTRYRSAGGLLGMLEDQSMASDNSSSATVIGIENVGSLIGDIARATVTRSYASGSVSGSYDTGGLAGLVFSDEYGNASLSHSFWNLDSNDMDAIGFLDDYEGGVASIDNVIGLTLTQLRDQNSYTDWDFDTVWRINPLLNGGLPYLQWMEDRLGSPAQGPVLATPIGRQQFATGDTVLVDVSSHFSDPDAGELTFSASDLPAGVSITAEGIIEGSAAPGRYQILVTATDSDKLTASDLFTLIISSFEQGNGSLSAPWQITSAAQLDEMRLHLSAHFELAADIDLDGTNWQPIGADYDTAFTGSLNGNGHVIRGLYVDHPELNEAGLFGTINGADIHSLALLDVTIISREQAGAIAGIQYDGSISRVQVTGYLEGMVTGALVGSASGTTLEDVFSHASVEAMIGGGLIGMSSDVVIDRAYVSGTVNAIASIALASGGLIGHAMPELTFTASYWLDSSAVSGLACAAAPCVEDPATIAALSADELRDAASFDGWDFSSTWQIDPLANDGLPFLRAVDSHITWLQEPTLSTVSPLGPIEEGETLSLTFEELLAASDAADGDGTIMSFTVVALDAGTLQIGGEDFDAGNNDVVDATRALAWTSVLGETGDIAAFTVVATDNDGLSTPALQVSVTVTALPPPVDEEEPGTQEPGTEEPGTDEQPTTGQPGNPVYLNNAQLPPGSYLAHAVISGPNTIIPNDIILGPGVKFAPDVPLPPGLDLTAALPPLQWISGDRREVPDLEYDIVDGADTILRAMQLLEEYEPSGNTLTQSSNGELHLIGENMSAAVLPVSISQAQPNDAPGTYIDHNGAIVIITADGRKVISHPIVGDQATFADALALLGLQFSYSDSTSLVVTALGDASNSNMAALSTAYFHYSGRPDAIALPANAHEVPGLIEYSVPSLGSVTGLALVFDQDNGTRMKQLIVPVPHNWPALRAALLAMAGIVQVSIDTQGIITVLQDDGVQIHGRADYVVTHGSGDGDGDGSGKTDAAVRIEAAGDISGNGTTDFRIHYANGHQQLLFVYPVQ